ncbi:hypothetical protein [Candidatus Desulfovibrio trichonymphae]|uniref:hypothetical protein n=1 Tax=Candidatus Desulfovibrio trichonymphae TaxID=1725232 RepID=UPI0018D523A4|nr:hypothetical protein [Candidatus Desulfovibrio trichonymphae]GHU90082.1 hypothetical protein AGMMS49925_01830 [Deltaproteobacteria bacterium]GHU95766.1 hypothetical protein AGMMS49974_07980 [Deltaproteobacteria bacterium]GHV00803.1 hypothetical protein AGMMS50248_10800 [Deltaproteobacteria bacterium]
MGLAIWISYARSGQAMPYLSHALSRWNMIKAEQKRVKGHAVPFTNEYDAAVNRLSHTLRVDNKSAATCSDTG